MIRRPPRSTQSRSSAASDVYKRQVDDHPRGDLRGLEAGFDAGGGGAVALVPAQDLLGKGRGEVAAARSVGADSELVAGFVASGLVDGPDGEIGEGVGPVGDGGAVPPECRGREVGLDGTGLGDDPAEAAAGG